MAVFDRGASNARPFAYYPEFGTPKSQYIADIVNHNLLFQRFSDPRDSEQNGVDESHRSR
jgi:hypothetical protein